MTIGKYILDAQGRPVLETNLKHWAAWMEQPDHLRVAEEFIGEIRVSTVFLGLDYNLSTKGAPVLWETKVFGGPLHYETRRSSGSREQAEAQHAEMVRRVKAALVVHK